MTSIIVKYKTRLSFTDDFIESVENLANLPAGSILLVLNDGPLVSNRYGQCIPRCLLHYTRDSKRVFDPYINLNWDCGIALSQETCQIKAYSPAFFTYLLGHELGHTYICLSDITLHIHSWLIEYFINEASDNTISKWHELPHEVLFDQFGMYIAENLFSREQLQKEITQKLEMPDCCDQERLKLMLTLKGNNNLNELREKLIDFSKPYKTKLIKLWEEHVAELGEKSLAHQIGDYESLFR